MSPLLIHIGFHKTASSWIQSELFNSSEVFENFSLNNQKQSSLAKCFYETKNGYLLPPFDFNQDEIKNEIDKILKEKEATFKNKIPVLSSERLSGNPHASGFDASIIANRLHNTFPDAKIVIVIREQQKMIASTYKQYLSIGGGDSIKDYLKRKYDGRRPGFSPYHFMFSKLITYYQQLFKKENILVLPYEMFDQTPDIFIAKIGELMGQKIDTTPLEFSKIINHKENSHLLYQARKWGFIHHKSSVNNFTKPTTTQKLKHRIACSLAGLFTSKLSFEKELKESIEKEFGDYYKEDNKKVGQLIGIDLDKYGY